jgi:hypothetical protein
MGLTWMRWQDDSLRGETMDKQKYSWPLRSMMASSAATFLLSCSPLMSSAETSAVNPAVILQVERKSCGSAPANTAPVVKWVGPRQLEVEAWTYETGRLRISESGSDATLIDDGTIQLAYRMRPADAISGAPSPTCLMPVRLRFIVLGLPQSDYQIILHQVPEDEPKDASKP